VQGLSVQKNQTFCQIPKLIWNFTYSTWNNYQYTKISFRITEKEVGLYTYFMSTNGDLGKVLPSYTGEMSIYLKIRMQLQFAALYTKTHFPMFCLPLLEVGKKSSNTIESKCQM